MVLGTEPTEVILPTAAAVASPDMNPDPVTVTFSRENFDARQGRGFALPGGSYRTLRIIVGEGKGHNWWGVIFPADENGLPCFSPRLSGPVLQREGYQLRFFLLDLLGRLQMGKRP